MSVSAAALCRYACALIGEDPRDDPDTLTYAPVWLTVILARLFGAENQIRAARGEALLSSPPIVAEIDDTPLPYTPELLLGPALYLLASSICSVNGDTDGMKNFLQDYRETLALTVPAVDGSVRNVYA